MRGWTHWALVLCFIDGAFGCPAGYQNQGGYVNDGAVNTADGTEGVALRKDSAVGRWQVPVSTGNVRIMSVTFVADLPEVNLWMGGTMGQGAAYVSKENTATQQYASLDSEYWYENVPSDTLLARRTVDLSDVIAIVEAGASLKLAYGINTYYFNVLARNGGIGDLVMNVTYLTGGCMICPSGTYNDLITTMVCAYCHMGMYCPTEGTVNGSCPAGYSCSDTSTKTICPAGKYCPLESVYPRACVLGEYCGVAGLSVAEPCPVNFYCPSTTQKIACPAGYACRVGSTQPRFICPVGQVPLTGTTCIECSQGTYNDGTGNYEFTGDTCWSCPLGKFAAYTGQSVCTGCPPRYYADETGLSRCKVCMACGPGLLSICNATYDAKCPGVQVVSRWVVCEC